MQESRLQKLLDFLEKDPSDPFLRYAIATEYLKASEPDLALKYFEGLVAQNAEYQGTYYHLGKLYETLGRKEDAVATYKKGMEVCRAAGNQHALSELQAAYVSAAGLEYED